MHHMLILILVRRDSFGLDNKKIKELTCAQEKWIVNALCVFINVRQNKFANFVMDRVIGEWDGCCYRREGL